MKFKWNPWVLNMIFWIILMLLVWCTTTKCSAQSQQAHYDTCYCKVECIQKFIAQPTSSGKSTRIYAVYIDRQNDISELIPVSKTVHEYITLCRNNGIRPQLGIKLKNGQIAGIIKYRKRYVKKR